MGDLVVRAETREEFGKNTNRRLRSQGRIPAVVYGKGISSTSVSVDPKDLHRILHSETGHNTIFKLAIGDNSRDVLIKDYQLDPVKGNLLHADFQAIAMDEALIFEVPVEVVGVAKGVQSDGGVLDIVLREIQLKCLPGDVPDHIPVEVHALEIGDTIRVENLQVDASKITLLSDPDLVVLTVIPPHVEKEPEVVLEEEEVGEPDLVKKGREEEEEEKTEEAEAGEKE